VADQWRQHAPLSRTIRARPPTRSARLSAAADVSSQTVTSGRDPRDICRSVRGAQRDGELLVSPAVLRFLLAVTERIRPSATPAHHAVTDTSIAERCIGRHCHKLGCAYS
jgi:hypothetical protein